MTSIRFYTHKSHTGARVCLKNISDERQTASAHVITKIIPTEVSACT